MLAFFLSLTTSLIFFNSCNKIGEINEHQNPASYSSDVLDKWMSMQIRLMKNSTGIPNHGLARHFAYSGVAALESIKPALPSLNKWSSKWNGLTGLPVPSTPAHYYYPASVNAALATMNRKMFPNASIADKAAIDSLETSLNNEFLQTQSADLIGKSGDFGMAVANAVYAWSETDGYKNANNPYSVPTGAGLWKPTPPAFAPPATPYWGNNRTIIKGSTANTQPTAPVPYSTDPSSPFYQMVKEVYDVSLTLTDEQKAMAAFWRDVPGVSSPGHWLSILQQVMQSKSTKLDKAVVAYALTGAAINDALIACFKSKYQYNLVRPVTYIREVMGQTMWNSFLGTPNHPEYPSAHSSLSAAAGETMEKLFGINSFVDHTYDYLGFAPRAYNSYTAIGEEAGQSRIYAGIHYLPSVDAGLNQGKKVADNIFLPSSQSE